MQVLLSIKPQHVSKIFSGEKKFEYRKSLFKDKSITTVVIYATLPVGKVVGEFKIERILEASPGIIWEETSCNSGIDKCFFDQYFKGRDKAYAIKIADYKIYDEPKFIKDYLPSNHPPQSFCYLN